MKIYQGIAVHATVMLINARMHLPLYHLGKAKLPSLSSIGAIGQHLTMLN